MNYCKIKLPFSLPSQNNVPNVPNLTPFRQSCLGFEVFISFSLQVKLSDTEGSRRSNRLVKTIVFELFNCNSFVALTLYDTFM